MAHDDNCSKMGLNENKWKGKFQKMGNIISAKCPNRKERKLVSSLLKSGIVWIISENFTKGDHWSTINDIVWHIIKFFGKVRSNEE